MKITNEDSWGNLIDFIEPKEILAQFSFSEDEFEKMKRGYIPQDMDDKWFLYMKNETLYFYRSWTGHKNKEISFKKQGNYYIASKMIVEGDASLYHPDNYSEEEIDAKDIIHFFLLTESARQPKYSITEIEEDFLTHDDTAKMEIIWYNTEGYIAQSLSEIDFSGNYVVKKIEVYDGKVLYQSWNKVQNQFYKNLLNKNDAEQIMNLLDELDLFNLIQEEVHLEMPGVTGIVMGLNQEGNKSYYLSALPQKLQVGLDKIASLCEENEDNQETLLIAEIEVAGKRFFYDTCHLEEIGVDDVVVVPFGYDNTLKLGKVTQLLDISPLDFENQYHFSVEKLKEVIMELGDYHLYRED
ncbi:MAG: hypothetical protein ACI31W_05765 [Lactococcus sp.]